MLTIYYYRFILYSIVKYRMIMIKQNVILYYVKNKGQIDCITSTYLKEQAHKMIAKTAAGEGDGCL